MLGVDDGLVSANYDAADLLFLLATIFFVIAAVAHFMRRTEVLGIVAAGAAFTAFGWFLL